MLVRDPKESRAVVGNLSLYLYFAVTPTIAPFFPGSGRILAPISAFLMAEDADNEILTSQSEHASTVVRLKPPMVREQIDVDNDSGGSRKCRESSASPLPLRFEVGASDEITSLVQRLRSYMVAELESSATRLL